MRPVSRAHSRRTMVASRVAIRDRLESPDMDAINGLLDGPRARRAFLLRCTMDPPWSLRIEDEAPLSLVAMLRGRACFVPDDAEPLTVGEGDVALVRGPEHYVFCDDPATQPQAIIHR